MAQLIIQAENISKVYRLGTLGSGSGEKGHQTLVAQKRYKKRK
jgi:hypothetical protein